MKIYEMIMGLERLHPEFENFTFFAIGLGFFVFFAIFWYLLGTKLYKGRYYKEVENSNAIVYSCRFILWSNKFDSLKIKDLKKYFGQGK